MDDLLTTCDLLQGDNFLSSIRYGTKLELDLSANIFESSEFLLDSPIQIKSELNDLSSSDSELSEGGTGATTPSGSGSGTPGGGGNDPEAMDSYVAGFDEEIVMDDGDMEEEQQFLVVQNQHQQFLLGGNNVTKGGNGGHQQVKILRAVSTSSGTPRKYILTSSQNQPSYQPMVIEDLLSTDSNSSSEDIVVLGGGGSGKNGRKSFSSGNGSPHSHSNGQELKLSDEERRLLTKEGITLPTHYPLTKFEERELKRIRRKIRNKISAQDSRKRKKEFVDTLQTRVQEVEEEKSFLSKKVRCLETANTKLQQQVKRLQLALQQQQQQQQQQQKQTTSKTASATTTTTLLVLILSLALVVLPGKMGGGQNGRGKMRIPNELLTEEANSSSEAEMFKDALSRTLIPPSSSSQAGDGGKEIIPNSFKKPRLSLDYGSLLSSSSNFSDKEDENEEEKMLAMLLRRRKRLLLQNRNIANGNTPNGNNKAFQEELLPKALEIIDEKFYD